MWGLIVVHSKQVFRFNCVRFNEVPLYIKVGKYQGSACSHPICPSTNPILGAKPSLLLYTWLLYMHLCSKKRKETRK